MGLKLAYALVFLVVLPAALVWWAQTLEGRFELPAYRSMVGGLALAVSGLAIWLAAVIEIVRKGEGLPMNAFPPKRFVSSGVYALVAHPIYLGWVLACAGVAWATGSAAGLWIVTPALALGCVALVVGFERPDLERRFGPAATFKPWLSLPPLAERRPTPREGVAFWLMVLLPWLLAYYAVKALGVPQDAIDIRLAAERSWPVWVWTAPLYASAYVIVPAAPLLVPTVGALRRLSVQGLVATGVVTLVYLVLPIVAPFREFEAVGTWGRLLAIDRMLASPPVAAFPAFHALWAAFAADAIAAPAPTPQKRSRARAVVAWAWAAGVALACVTTGMHALADVAAAAIFYVALRRPDRVWRAILDLAERLANSWRAWRVGPLRIINHSLYAGAAAWVGMLGMNLLGGSDWLVGYIVIALGVLFGAAAWAQWVEGSPALQRPFGYYGAVLGGAAGTIVAAWLGQPAALVLAATAAMAPWIHAIGRLRCLVQGCCHGRVARDELGIKVCNPHSRVVKLAGLEGRSIHPTQVYSILANVVIGLLLLRLWTIGAPLWFVTGSYLLLAGLARFMEEGYRGEPQTPRWFGLPMYQPMAIGSVIAGAILMSLGGPPAPAVVGTLDTAVWFAAAATALAYGFAMGVDFPEWNRRLARLSG